MNGLSLSTLAGLVQRFWGIPQPFDVTLVTGGFSDALVAKVQCPLGEFALRGWPADASESRVRELHVFLKHLQRFNLPVAVPKSLDCSLETLVELHGRLWQLEPWLPGESLSTIEINERRLRDVMEAVARLHLAAERFSEKTQWLRVQRGCSPTITERRMFLSRWNDQTLHSSITALRDAPQPFLELVVRMTEIFRQHRSRIDDELQLLEKEVVPLQPCWRDLWSDHVLMTGNQVTGFIDAAATRTDHVSTDLSRLLGSLLADDRLAWERALAMYCDIRPLSQVERGLIRVMDRSAVLLSGLNWIDRWQSGMIRSERLMAVQQRLERILDRLHHLEKQRS